MNRREFLKQCLCTLSVTSLAGFGLGRCVSQAMGAIEREYNPEGHNYAMGVAIDRCIGCGRCAAACKNENNVPREPFYFRTWVERYVVVTANHGNSGTHPNGAIVDSPNGGVDGFPKLNMNSSQILRTFFVPKLCNHCAEPPCVQVCPVGATFQTRDGVVLVDDDYCVGCSYCIQACPYGARFMHPIKRVASKCTFCYHRIVKGLLPVCVEVCPTKTRIFGEVNRRNTPLARFVRFNKLQVLKPGLNTEPKVYYSGLDGEVT